MQVTETNAEGLRREFTVIVPANDIKAKMDARLSQLGNTVKMPGFRPGKVPINLLKSRFGDSVRGEVLEQTVQDSFRQAMDDQGLRPATEPDIKIVSFEEGADLEYTLAIELMPDIGEPDFAKIKLERLMVKVSDDEIDNALKRIAEQRQNFAPVADRRAAASGDQVLIDFIGRVDGEEFEGGTITGFELVLGSNQFLLGFEDQLIGAKGGESKKVAIKVDDDHPSDQIKGKVVDFDVTVHEIRGSAPVEINDELAKESGLQSLDALKDTLRQQLEGEYSQATRARIKRDLLDYLSDVYDFDVPEGIVSREFETIWNQLKEAMEKDQLDEEDKDVPEDELHERYRMIAERRVRLGLLLSEVGRINNLTVTQEEVNRAMQQEASRFPGHEAKVIEHFQKNPQSIQEIQAPLFEEKVVDFIIALAKVTEREVSVQDLLDESEAERKAAASKGKGKKASGAKSKPKATPKRKSGAQTKQAD